MHEVLVPVWVGIHLTLVLVAVARQVWRRVTGL